MSQRNPMNDRYQTDEHRGQTRKSAATMKPKTKAASSVRIQPTVKTKQQKKADKKAARAKQTEIDRQYYNPPTPEYKRLRKIWWGLLIGAIVMTAMSWFGRAFLPEVGTYVVLGLAYVCIIGALYVDFSKIRKVRRAYQEEMMSKKTKEMRAAEKQQKAAQRAAKQKVLGAALAEELAQMGLHNAHMDEYGYVYAWLPATAGCEGIPCVGLIAHMDTSPDAPGAGVKPRVVRYEGGDLVLNEEKGIVMRAAEFESLAKYKGQELIVTDGTTLLGADDKAGVAEIMSAVEYLLQHPELPHGRIAVGFTPDEEVGQGADHFDVEGFGAAVAYTVDGGELGELEYENFNAANAGVYFHGVNIHPGSAKNKMKNAILIALEFAGMLPPAETPAHTEGYEGFYHLHDMKGSETEAELHYILRDHDRARFEARKEYLGRAADYLNAKYGAGTVELVLKDSYYNMREQIEPHMYLILRARAAMEAAGVTPVEVPIRGGTDGARLSYMGLPCPNLCTGGVNFHGVHEYIPAQALTKMTEVLVNLLTRQ